MKNRAMAIFLIVVLAGCASGSALMIGTARTPIEDYQTVRILTEKPPEAVEIALVKASSDMGWTEQDSLNYAVEELKKQAAKVGANAVVITVRDTSNNVSAVPVYGGGTVVSSSSVEIIQGIAIWDSIVADRPSKPDDSSSHSTERQ